MRLVVTHRRRLVKPFQPHGFHDACDLFVIGRGIRRVFLEACGDAFSAVKPVLIVEDGLYSCTNKGIGMHF